MKTLFEVLREPLVIGAFIVALFIVVGAYVLSSWHYGKFDVDPLTIESDVSGTVDNYAPSINIDLPELVSTDNKLVSSQSSSSDDTSLNSISSESDSYELTPEDEVLLLEHFRETLPPLRESVFGLGPYPDVPPDYPKQDVFDRLERYANASQGQTTIDHELIARVLIEYWHQGKKTSAGVLSGSNGRVYPLFKDTVYVKWTEFEHEDGSISRYLGNYICHGSLADYEDSVENGTHPSWMKVVLYEDGGVDPYSFLDLP